MRRMAVHFFVTLQRELYHHGLFLRELFLLGLRLKLKIWNHEVDQYGSVSRMHHAILI